MEGYTYIIKGNRIHWYYDGRIIVSEDMSDETRDIENWTEADKKNHVAHII